MQDATEEMKGTSNAGHFLQLVAGKYRPNLAEPPEES